MTAATAAPHKPAPTEFQPFRLLRGLASSVVRRVHGWTREARVLAAVWAVFLVLTTLLSYQRYLTYQTNAWDLGINMQALWTTAFQGRFLYYTAELSWNANGSLMGVHFVPFLFVLAPLYRVVPGALTLFTLQSLAVCLSSLPLYLLAARRASRRAALAIAVAYLFSAPLLGGLFYDFHSEAFVPLFGLTVWYAWDTRKPRLLAISAVAFLSVIEFTPIILGAIAVMFLLEGLWSWKVKHASVDPAYLRWMVFLPLVVLAICAVLTPIWFTLPKIISPGTPPVAQAGVLGGSPPQIFFNLFNPSLVGQALSVHSYAKVLYLEALLLSGLVLWVLSPREVLPAAPWIGTALLSSASAYFMPAGDQYMFLSFPFLLPAAASGYGRLSRRIERLRQSRALAPPTQPVNLCDSKRPWSLASGGGPQSALQVTLVCALVVAFGCAQLYWSPLSPVATNWEKVYKTPTAHTRLLGQVAQLVPSTASISAEPDLFPQFADRADAYPYIVPGVSYIFFDTTSFWFTTMLPPPATNPPWSEEIENVSGAYGVLASSNGVILLEAGYTGIPIVFSAINQDLTPGAFSLPNASVMSGGQSPFGAYIAPGRAENASLWFGAIVNIQPGAYELGLWLRGSGQGVGPVELRVTITPGSDVLKDGWFSPSQLETTWTLVQWNLTVHYPGSLDLAGLSGSVFSGVDFGGAQLSEAQLPVQVT